MGNRELEGALSALVEGDATLAQYDFMREALSQRELIALLATALSLNVSANEAPAIVQSWLEFPYVEGLAFAAALRANGGTKQVNAAFDALPATTEQILHPARYFAGEPALAVSLPDAGALLGPGWEVAEQNVLGEFFLRAWLEALGVPPRAAAGAAAGWGGDAYVVLRSGESGAALAARIVWDDAAAGGDEFVSAIAAALDATPTFAMREELALPVDGATGLTWAGPGGVLGVARFAGRRRRHRCDACRAADRAAAGRARPCSAADGESAGGALASPHQAAEPRDRAAGIVVLAVGDPRHHEQREGEQAGDERVPRYFPRVGRSPTSIVRRTGSGLLRTPAPAEHYEWTPGPLERAY